jgi:riboflavin biosynthesis pyrimidine reductase
MEPLQRLYDAGAYEPLPLPEELERLYGGPLRLSQQGLYANFVQSIDGVVAIASVPSPGSVISLHSEADRFVMALLRAAAEAVLIGAGTLRDGPGHQWTPEGIDRQRAGAYAELRRRLGLPPQPRLVVLTARGDVDPHHPGFEPGALIVTTELGAERLAGALPGSCEVLVLAGDQRIDVGELLVVLRGGGLGRILSEAGPTVTRQLLAGSLLDELFLTQSPVLIGGERAARPLSGEASLPGHLPGGTRYPAELLSAGRHGSHLFLRYRFAGASSIPPAGGEPSPAGSGQA